MTMGSMKRATHGGPSLCPRCGLPACECEGPAPAVAATPVKRRDVKTFMFLFFALVVIPAFAFVVSH